MIFYLGTTEYTWLARKGEAVPYFVNYHTLLNQEKKRKSKFLPAVDHWALDSGGFTELKLYGKWTLSPTEYVRSTRRYVDEIGKLDWAAIQDWMCEDMILRKTGLSVPVHQRRTIESYLDLKAMDPDLPWAPVLQGWLMEHYLDHIEQYAKAGIDLAKEPIVALGTMCKRQDTVRAAWIIRELVAKGLRCHALGAKVVGLAGYYQIIASADSDAWSFGARTRHFRFSTECNHKGDRYEDCRNCYNWALAWRANDVLGSLPPEGTEPSDRDEEVLKKGSRVRAEHGGALLAPFKKEYLR